MTLIQESETTHPDTPLSPDMLQYRQSSDLSPTTLDLSLKWTEFRRFIWKRKRKDIRLWNTSNWSSGKGSSKKIST